MSDSFLELRNLKKVLHQKNMFYRESICKLIGGIRHLAGASGCGKTTTLRIIAGLEQPDSGSVWLEGKDVTNLEAKPERCEHGISELCPFSPYERGG